ncbi:undecaprenyl-diphosphate phosphatase, partial [Methanocaldococcus sp.]
MKDIIILSIVEGLTEFLPISSTAHLILISKLLSINQTPEHITFEVII